MHEVSNLHYLDRDRYLNEYIREPRQVTTNWEEPVWKPVLTKANFTIRYFNGEFGNRSPTWLHPNEFAMLQIHETDGNLYHLRNRIAGGGTHYKQTWEQALNLWWSKPDPDTWYCSMQIPPEVEASILIQGEVMQAPPHSGMCGLALYYSTVAKPMREALALKSNQVSGIMVKALLETNLCPNSYDWLNELLCRYPYHVVEFSAYSKKWGTLYPDYNTVFWEVRNY